MNSHVLGELLFFAGYVSFAYAASALTGIALRLNERWLNDMPAEAQSRVLLGAALIPALVFFSVFCGSVVHFLFSGPMNFCRSDEEVGGAPSVLLTGVLLLAGARAVTVLWRLAGSVRGQVGIRRRFPVRRVRQDGVAVTGGDLAMAFVTGVFSPKIYLTERLVEKCAPDELRFILAHEQSHVRRRDPLRRLLAALSGVLHLPLVAKWIEVRLERAQEASADDCAARRERDRVRLAEIMVAFSKLQPVLPSPAFEFAEGNLEFRVRRLLCEPRLAGGPSSGALLGIGAGLLALALLSGQAMHWAAQAITRLP